MFKIIKAIIFAIIGYLLWIHITNIFNISNDTDNILFQGSAQESLYTSILINTIGGSVITILLLILYDIMIDKFE